MGWRVRQAHIRNAASPPRAMRSASCTDKEGVADAVEVLGSGFSREFGF